MRPDRSAGGFGEIVYGLHKARSRGVGVHVKNKYAATIKTCEPELAPVIRKSTVVRLVSTFDGGAADHFAVVRRAGLYIDSHKFIRAVSEAFNAERPDVNELFLTIDAGEIR